MNAGPTVPPFGADIAAVDLPTSSAWWSLPLGVRFVESTNCATARMVAAETDNRIAWPFRILGFVDPEFHVAAAVIHVGAAAGADDSLEAVVYDGDLAWTRTRLRLVAERVFVTWGATELVIRLTPGDEAGRAALGRLGFASAGRDDRDGRLVYRITAQAACRRLWPRLARELDAAPSAVPPREH